MKKSIYGLFACLFLLTLITGCNTGNEGAAERESNGYQQIEHTPNNGNNPTAEQTNNNDRFPFNLFGGDERGGNGGETGLPVPDTDLEIEEGDVPDESELPGQPQDGTGDGTGQRQQQPENPGNQEDDSIQRQDEPQTDGNQDTGSSATGVEQKVIELTNQEREKNGLSPLKADPQVTKTARAKSRDMASNNYFAHNSPTYGSPFNMLSDFGVNYTAAAENIAAGQQTPEEVVQAWMNSEGHRKNILNQEVTHIGVGYVEDGNHWTQMFIGK
ncbi:uncharacterized protein, YkwD family [Alteribacillus persepolensis]|uniref:Uncharacterized protein, YkwD family n=1 Tax=Alteribacillus persepolensis TaxID=568899 RepID=A0A1G8C2I7_9BACI|nr:CAP domain-containing protein [Alteribacillus persepolensis]SDH39682.1 uncharacterized protein, YkwD family [Alteribacillus persepolensis]